MNRRNFIRGLLATTTIVAAGTVAKLVESSPEIILPKWRYFGTAVMEDGNDVMFFKLDVNYRIASTAAKAT